MIFKSAIIAAAAFALVAILTGKDIVRQHTVVLAGKRYEITRYSNETIEVFREDGVQFAVDLKTGRPTLQVGTDSQMQEALAVIQQMAVDQLSRAA